MNKASKNNKISLAEVARAAGVSKMTASRVLRGEGGYSEKTKRKVEFLTKQMTDALSPTNFALTNPDVIKAQMESGIGYGIGHVMRDEITLDGGEVVQQNFPDYEPLRIGDIAAIETHIIASSEAPTGVGEPGLPPAGPALANAIAVEGPRVTILPMTNSGVTFA